jgi:hypothetical protein
MWPLIALRSKNCVPNMMNFIFFFPLKVEKFFPHKKKREEMTKIIFSLFICNPKAIKNVRGLYLIQTCDKICIAYLEEHLRNITKNPWGISQKPRFVCLHVEILPQIKTPAADPKPTITTGPCKLCDSFSAVH